MKVVTLDKFKGLRNTHHVLDVDDKGASDLEAAQNVDIDDAQKLHRRKGYSEVIEGGSWRSLWSDGVLALAIKDGTSLARIFPDYTHQVLRAGLAALPMSYAPMGGRAYYSNGADTGVVDAGRSRSWGIVPPPAQPTAELTGGTLRAGTYQYAVTYLRADMQESGTPRAGTVDVDTGGFRLVDFHLSDDPDVAAMAVYVSKCNGDTLYRAGIVPASAMLFDWQADEVLEVALRTQHLQPAPAGRFVDSFSGRTLVASGSALYPSEPFAPELFDLRKVVRFMDPIEMLVALDSGVYVGTGSEVIWLDGTDPAKWVFSRRLDYGAIRGAFSRCARDVVLDGQGTRRVAVFATDRGICVGQDGGEVANLTQDRFAYPIQETGALLVRRHRGMVQCVASLQGTERPGNSL